ncbi:MAG: M48 family metallopeptidase [Thermovirgaceae bacterium]
MLKRRVSLFLPFALVLLLFACCGISAAEGELSERERKLRDRTIKQVEEHWEVVKDPSRSALVEMIGSRCAALAERDLAYSFRLLSDDRPNAFTIPGGVIYVSTGMLDFVRSDDELAAILSHEIVHADKDHVMRQVARNQKLSVASLLLTVASGGAAPVAVLSNLIAVAVQNDYSRDFEQEADRGSVEILHGAGYSPSATVTVLERLQEEEVKRPYVDPGVYRTHPRTEERVRDIISYMHDQGLTIERKEPLGLLVPEVLCSGDACVFRLDGREIWRGPWRPGTKDVLKKLERAVSQSLQLETAPYDIHVIKQGGTERLLIERTVAVDATDVPPEMAESLGPLRDSLVRALQAAKSIHPVAEYFR